MGFRSLLVLYFEECTKKPLCRSHHAHFVGLHTNAMSPFIMSLTEAAKCERSCMHSITQIYFVFFEKKNFPKFEFFFRVFQNSNAFQNFKYLKDFIPKYFQLGVKNFS